MCNGRATVSKSQRRLTRAERKFYKELHNLADRMQPKVKRGMRNLIEALRKDLTINQLQDAIRMGSTHAVLSSIQLSRIERYIQPIIDELTMLIKQAAEHSAQLMSRELLQKATVFEMSFNLMNQETVRFLRQYKLGLVNSITRTTRDGLRSIIRMGQTHGLTVRQQAMRIRDLIGLTPKQVGALDKFRNNLVGGGWSKAEAEARVLRMAVRQHRARAEAIARTETIRAANAGQQQLWQQAKEQDLLEPEAKQVWIVTSDDRLCEVCEPIPSMNPEGVPVNGVFDTPNGPMSGPPAHPNCRCAVGIG